ncbi:hypothetical protein ABEB36_009631 [Hypothenemus hampei]|uniref:THAP-type domain-containing protein n=1 Tax=Hypothenemus hampei TaxID=57062 RepID=A0ABD1EL15_HYPHA
MPGCAVANCKNFNRKTKGTDIRYFRFPKNEDLAKQWVSACGRKDEINLKNACVCSLHFDDKSVDIPLKHKLLKYSPRSSRILRADAVPTINIPKKPLKDNNEGNLLGVANVVKAPNINISGGSSSAIEECQDPIENMELDNIQLLEDSAYQQICKKYVRLFARNVQY